MIQLACFTWGTDTILQHKPLGSRQTCSLQHYQAIRPKRQHRNRAGHTVETACSTGPTVAWLRKLRFASWNIAPVFRGYQLLCGHIKLTSPDGFSPCFPGLRRWISWHETKEKCLAAAREAQSPSKRTHTAGEAPFLPARPWATPGPVIRRKRTRVRGKSSTMTSNMIFGWNILLNPRVAGKRHTLVSPVRYLKAPTTSDICGFRFNKSTHDYFDIKQQTGHLTVVTYLWHGCCEVLTA